jgi:lipoprotein-anchoring transpeptidase ErfK/SrfK
VRRGNTEEKEKEMIAFILTSMFVALGQTRSSPPLGTAEQSKPTTSHTEMASPDDALELQVMLDRAGFSPGVIDGHMGSNTRKALDLFSQSGNQPSTVAATTTYRITAEDAAGPFIDRAPDDMMETAKLPALGYTSVLEELAERFHSTPALLQQLNRGVEFAADQEIQVPNVDPMMLPISNAPTATDSGNHPRESSPQPTGTSGTQSNTTQRPDVVVTVTKSTSSLTVADANGRVVFYAPVTTGSEHDPLPIGEWKVTGMQFNPQFHYNPDLFWDADPSHTKATVQPGPNNPVGLVWINLSKEHYGLHGTPEPATIGRTQSHGCVRLTNWDALKVAALVQPGTRVIFAE